MKDISEMIKQNELSPYEKEIDTIIKDIKNRYSEASIPDHYKKSLTLQDKIQKNNFIRFLARYFYQYLHEDIHYEKRDNCSITYYQPDEDGLNLIRKETDKTIEEFYVLDKFSTIIIRSNQEGIRIHTTLIHNWSVIELFHYPKYMEGIIDNPCYAFDYTNSRIHEDYYRSLYGKNDITLHGLIPAINHYLDLIQKRVNK